MRNENFNTNTQYRRGCVLNVNGFIVVHIMYCWTLCSRNRYICWVYFQGIFISSYKQCCLSIGSIEIFEYKGCIRPFSCHTSRSDKVTTLWRWRFYHYLNVIFESIVFYLQHFHCETMIIIILALSFVAIVCVSSLLFWCHTKTLYAHKRRKP